MQPGAKQDNDENIPFDCSPGFRSLTIITLVLGANCFSKDSSLSRCFAWLSLKSQANGLKMGEQLGGIKIEFPGVIQAGPGNAFQFISFDHAADIF